MTIRDRLTRRDRSETGIRLFVVHPPQGSKSLSLDDLIAQFDLKKNDLGPRAAIWDRYAGDGSYIARLGISAQQKLLPPREGWKIEGPYHDGAMGIASGTKRAPFLIGAITNLLRRAENAGALALSRFK